jgi:uncharacterized membrane protein
MAKEEKTVKANFEHPYLRTQKTLGQKASDKLTKVVGSWGFIIVLLLIIVIWVLVNAHFLVNYGKEPIDPFPFILLNLTLSCLAAIQAPIILMSQNRQAQKDRLREEFDYRVDKKAEKEIQEIKKQLNRIEERLKK